MFGLKSCWPRGTKNLSRLKSLKKQLAVLFVFALVLLWWSNSSIALGQATKRNGSSTSIISRDAVEQFSFLIKDFKIEHQGENNNLNITLRYRYKSRISTAEYPDFRLIMKDIQTLLTNYPNEEDYWEIVNKRITLMVFEKYPVLTRITSQIQVSPSTNVPYLRSSIITRDRAGLRKRQR